MELPDLPDYVWDGTYDLPTIAAGTFHTAALLEDGSIRAVGNVPGDTSWWKDLVAIAAGDFHMVGLQSDGTVVSTGSSYYGQCDVHEWTDIVSIAAHAFTTVGIRSDGTVAQTVLGHDDRISGGEPPLGPARSFRKN